MSNADVQTAYPSRYYVSYDKTLSGLAPVTGWYDAWIFSNVSDMPSLDTLMAITLDQWNVRTSQTYGVQNGVLTKFDPIGTPSLAYNAGRAYAEAVQYVQTEYLILNEATPDNWVTYLKALKAIRDGTDTTSTALPVSPSS